jgi:mRNA interferase MazF
LIPLKARKFRRLARVSVLTSDILNNFRQTVVVAPLSTSAKPHPPITIPISCAGKSVVAVIDQILAVARHRLKSKIEVASPEIVHAVTSALAEILEMRV